MPNHPRGPLQRTGANLNALRRRVKARIADIFTRIELTAQVEGKAKVCLVEVTSAKGAGCT